MKLFRITDLNLIEPFTVLAETRDDAANYFVASMNRGFGRVPVIEYAVTHWRPRNLNASSDLKRFVDSYLRGFAWEKQSGWELINPFDEQG